MNDTKAVGGQVRKNKETRDTKNITKKRDSRCQTTATLYILKRPLFNCHENGSTESDAVNITSGATYV